MDTKIIAILAVAIVAVAGVSAVFLMGGDDDDNDKDNFTFDSNIEMMVFGNVNNDDKLDATDAADLKKMLDEDTFVASEHPYADANRDGKVNSDDVAYINKLVAHEDGTVVYYYNTIDEKIAKVTLPLENVVIVGTLCCTAALVLDFVDNIKGVHDTSSWDDAFAEIKAKDKVSDLSIGAVGLSMELFSKVSEKVEGGIDAVITTAAMGSDYYPEDDLDAIGVPSVKMSFGTEYDLNSYITLGFLMDKSDRAQEYVEFVDKVDTKVNEVLAQAKADNVASPTVLAMFGSPGMGGGFVDVTESQDVDNIKAAGGKIADGVPDDGTEDPEDGVWIYDMDADYGVISCQGMTYNSSATWWGKIKTIIDDMKQLKECLPADTYLINRNLPGLVQTAYLLELFYPEYVDAGYGDTISQEWVDKYYAGALGDDYDVTEHLLFVKLSDL